MCETNFASCADDNTLYVSRDSINDVIKSLEDDSINRFKCFLDNQTKANSDECHLITNKLSYMNLKIGDTNIKNSTSEKLLGIKVGNKFNFNEHLDGIIKKVIRKVSALSSIFPFIDLTKRRFLMNSFFAGTALLSECVIVGPLITK